MSKRILLIEDDPDFLSLMMYLLKDSGHALLIARNGQEGLEKARKEQPDLILTDLMLPKLNGYEICTLLKQDALYQAIPVILLSATKIDDKDEQLAKECGADAYLRKSLSPPALMRAIQDLLSAKRAS